MRRQPRGAIKSFWLKAKSPPELDCHPIWFINDAGDAEQVWGRIAPPRTVVRTSTAIKEKSTSFPVWKPVELPTEERVVQLHSAPEAVVSKMDVDESQDREKPESAASASNQKRTVTRSGRKVPEGMSI